MKNNFRFSLNEVLKHEGGFVDHPKDPGGATNKGITIGTYRRFIKRSGTVEDLKNISDAEVATVYRKQYWDKVRCDDLQGGLDFAMFDYAVNSGPSRAAKELQNILGITADGKVGPQTLAELNGLNVRALIDALCDKRLAFLKRLKHWPTFKNGWSSRVASVNRNALSISGDTETKIEQIKPRPKPKPIPKQTKPKPTGTAKKVGIIGAFLAIVYAALKYLGVIS